MKSDVEIIEALDAVQDARLIIEQKIADRKTSDEEKESLEETSFLLQRMERSLLKEATDKLVEELTGDALKLQVVINEIKKSTSHLEKVAATLSKVSNTVEKVIKVAGVVSASGLL